MLDRVTPIVLTFNEAANIGRSLRTLGWARRVLVVDSFSSDETVAIARSFANVAVVQNRFVDLATQLNFALDRGGIDTDWVLRMDADFTMPQALIDAIAALEGGAGIDAYRIPFKFAIHGRLLRGSLYPALPLLARRAGLRYRQDGHADKAVIAGAVGDIASPMIHDDRKDLGRWLQSQWSYMAREAEKLRQTPFAALDWPDRVRKTRLLGPPAIVLYCLFFKALVLDGWAGMFYTLQRAAAETILSLCLIERDLQALTSGHDDHPRS